MPSTETHYTAAEKRNLLVVARASILHRLEHGRAAHVNPLHYTQALRELRASFVTLELDNNLRGCVGNLKAIRPLVKDVAQNAADAAFCDPRFTPLTAAEFAHLALSISVLSPAQIIPADSETTLLRQLQPGIDGLILEHEGQHETFLPSVWETLPEPRDFLRHLKRKAGLPEDAWPATMRVLRYTAELIS